MSARSQLAGVSARRPALRRLATRLGVVDAYHDLSGRLWQTTDATRAWLCRAMGHEADDEAAAAAALAALERREATRWIAPVAVWREHDHLAPALRVRAPEGERAVGLRVELHAENGGLAVRECELPPRRASTDDEAARVPLQVPLPVHPGLGRHRVRAIVDGEESTAAVQWLIVAPRRAVDVTERLGGGRGFGVWTNVYTLRSARNDGIGDLGDLGLLVRACGAWGGEFVGLSPLHAIPNTGTQVSPYGPVSRRYKSPLTLELRALPEWSAIAARAGGTGEVPDALRRLRDAGAVDYDAVCTWKEPLLRAAYDAFLELPATSERRRACAAWCEAEGEALERFATWSALDAWLRPECGAGDWRRWPEPYRDPSHEAVARFRRERAREVEFHAWLQFELDRQLGALAGTAREAGLRIGLYGDLAVGPLAGSADTWSARADFAPGVALGAPPDAFAPDGQNWGVAAFDPHRLREAGYAPFACLVAAALRHMGALRIDHVLGLQRQFWVPEGRPASEGAYVRFPLDDLLGVVALESWRNGAVVVGEDLGTVSPDLPASLASFGLLSSCVLAFERESDGSFRPPARLSARALASANTHDLAPLAGHLAGRDLTPRAASGEQAAAAPAARKARDAEREALVARLRSEGLWSEAREPEGDEWCRLTAALLARAPAPLVAVSLDDMVGETEPVHLPGIGADRHPSWRRRMREPLEQIVASETIRQTLPLELTRRHRREEEA